MIHTVKIPDPVGIIIQNDLLGGKIIGEIFLKYLIDLAVRIFKYNICLLVDSLDVSAVIWKFFPHTVTAIENNELRLSDHLSQQRSHICVIHGEGGSVYNGDLLVYLPVPGQLTVFVIPYTVPLNDDAVRLNPALNAA